MSKNITFVTGIWDLNRGNAKPGWNRSFDHYKEKFRQLLIEMKDHNLFIYIDPSLESFVWQHRSPNNTQIAHHSKEQFGGNFFPFFDKVQQIRKSPKWYSQVGWLKDSTQASLEYYNPMVMSKMFLLHNAKITSSFNDDYMYWIDGGITNTMSLGYFNDTNVLNNLKKISNKFLFVCFPYETNSEIHGFNIQGMQKYAESPVVNRVARGGFFGGNKDYISEANSLYYGLLNDSLNDHLMGTEESIFTIMTYKDPTKYKFEMIDSNGLIYKFFEDLQSKKFVSQNKKKINLYIITYNAPKQLQLVLDSFSRFDMQFITDTNMILVNNTIDGKCFAEYERICRAYNIKEYRHNNIGICGGRQWTAQHFADSDADYMFFFEDDMLLDLKGKCPFGFRKYIPNPFNNFLDIMDKEKYSFLKLCFTEFYGDNSKQWAWHNIPPKDRIKLFGDIAEKPNTKFTTIKSHEGIPYAEGEIYYCNWPHIIGKEGNQKCFMDTVWDHPYEQTWMSHIFQLTKTGVVKPGILLASPFTHNRIIHYEREERREN